MILLFVSGYFFLHQNTNIAHILQYSHLSLPYKTYLKSLSNRLAFTGPQLYVFCHFKNGTNATNPDLDLGCLINLAINAYQSRESSSGVK